jgi:hypothetical protein
MACLYLFKFIVPTKIENVEKVESAFNCMGAVIKTTKSKTGKFTSIYRCANEKFSRNS